MSKLIVDKCDLKIGDTKSFTWHDAMIIVEILNRQNYKGYNNWRLPTKDELNYLYKNEEKIGGFGSSDYWSSSEDGNYDAWFQDFDDGRQYNGGKSNYLLVRCVRSI